MICTDGHILILEPVVVSFYGKRDFAAMFKLGILRGGDYPGSSRWALSSRGSCKRETEGAVTPQRMYRHGGYALKMERGVPSQGIQVSPKSS